MQSERLYREFLITSMVASFEPIEVASARGTRIAATDGKEYLDCFSGISVVNVGHNHPSVVAAAKEQMDKFVHAGTYIYYNPQAALLAERLQQITPGRLQKTFFANSGAEAIEGAMRLAKQFTAKQEFVALTYGFHGRTSATLSITGNRSRKKRGGPYLSGVAFAPAPYFYRCPFGSRTEEECGERCAQALRDVLRYQTSGDVAAFVAEPVMGEGGILVPPPNYFRLVSEILKEEGILFLADEVQSGFGRTGKMFAVEHYGVEPDLMAMAKGIAGGFPLGAFIARPEVSEAFAPGDHLSTFGGNPISCAAALATIDVLQKERLAENATARGRQIMEALRLKKEKYPIVGDIRGKGLMIGIELVKDASKTPAPQAAQSIRKYCREAGMLVGVGGVFGNVVRIQPPLILSESEAAQISDTLEKAFRSS
jgi:4-aminobutyrate aminotransferase / (S)-3-amino-2-methylpropionate transaminase / 5-aminovalerate transaminase